MGVATTAASGMAVLVAFASAAAAAASCPAGKLCASATPDAEPAALLQTRAGQALHKNDADLHPSRKSCKHKPYPLIWDNDANYDDMLVGLYLAASPRFDLKAITVEATGMGTPAGGAPNMAALAAMVGKGNVPVAYGHPEALSPIATMPLEWRIGVDKFIESMYNLSVLEMTQDSISPLTAPQLILKVLKESDCPVVVITTGPVTNLAVALESDPSAAANIKAVFMMGSAYGVPGTNNVYDWQMEWNGVLGSCAEVAPQTYTGLSAPLNENYGKVQVRKGCRGLNMTEAGDTEWNVFLDVRAWWMTYKFLSKTPAKVYVLAANATMDMAVTVDEFENAADKLSNGRLSTFVVGLAKSFIGAGEAKWWDAQTVVMMDDVLSGRCAGGGGVCAGWARSKRTSVGLVWRSQLDPGEKLPYGQIKDDPDADSPLIDYCVFGSPSQMRTEYWAAVDRIQSSLA